MEITLQQTPEFLITRRDTVITSREPAILHHHNGYELDLFIASRNHCFIKNVRYETRERTLLLILPHEVHNFYYEPGTSYTRFVINFSESFLLPLLQAQGQSDLLQSLQNLPYRMLSLSSETFNRLSFLFTELFNLTHQKNPFRPLLQSYLLCILLELHQRRDRFQPPPPLSKSGLLIQQVIQYIDTHYMDPITLEDLEQRFFVDKYHLCHLFKRETDTSVVSYLQYRRIIEAQKLLMNSEFPIIDICYQCGFHNLQHFYRTFKKFIGYTPRQYQPKLSDNHQKTI
ncbi:MAG: AraC family transcriptional regulator [Candidatus Merdivicinus sp.]